MAQRSRKRGRRTTRPRPQGPAPSARVAPQSAPLSRSEQRNQAVRATLTPLAPGERPWPIVVGAVLAAAVGASNLIAYAAGVKIAGKHPAPGGIVLFSLVMLVCAAGLWRMWYGAVLAFMALLAIIVTLFSLYLVEASNVLGFLIPPVIIAGCGYLFWKLVRVLSRIQMPKYPGR